MLPKLNPRRAQFVLAKIDEILAWEQRKEAEKDTRWVELGRYLCEVRARQYWRGGKLKTFDKVFGPRLPETRNENSSPRYHPKHPPPPTNTETKQQGCR